MGEGTFTHTPSRVESPKGWSLYVSHSDRPVSRLVVFVHGFMGNPISTWTDFPSAALTRQWWADSDLLFVGYRSTKGTINGVALQFLQELPKFFPAPFEPARIARGQPAREQFPDYNDLVVVGHSLGGVIVRRAVAHATQQWSADPTRRSPIMGARVRLFSPAIAGFRPAGILGLLASTERWKIIEMFARSSPAYIELQRGSEVLLETRQRTEALAAAHEELESLRPDILWAEPDRVVLPECYVTDTRVSVLPDTSHKSVCKPGDDFTAPWDFVERGL